MEVASQQTPAVADYFAKRDICLEARLAIVRVLDAAGLNGWQMVRASEHALEVKEQAYRAMGHEDRMTVLTRENAELAEASRSADELLSRIKRDREFGAGV